MEAFRVKLYRLKHNPLEVHSAFKLGSLLKANGAYKSKGVPVLGIFVNSSSWPSAIKTCLKFCEQEEELPSRRTPSIDSSTPRTSTGCVSCSLSERVINGKIVPLTDAKRGNVFIVDDTVYERNRSKNVELLSRVCDHSRKVFVRGFRLLTLGWSDGNTFVPAGSCLPASADGDNRFQEARSVDKRSC